MQHIESQHAQALIEWHEIHKNRLPGLELLFHVPMGGKRNPREGARLKREGAKGGIPDYWLPVPRGGFSGLVFELKSEGNYPNLAQRWWFHRLTAFNWLCFCAWDWEKVTMVIEYYLGDVAAPPNLAPPEIDTDGWLRIKGEKMVKLYK